MYAPDDSFRLTLTVAGASEQAAFQEHAYGLGAGPGGLLGFAESGIHAVRACLADRCAEQSQGWALAPRNATLAAL